MKYLFFQVEKNFIFVVICSLFLTMRKCVEKFEKDESKLNPLFMFMGQSLAIFVFLYQKKFSKHKANSKNAINCVDSNYMISIHILIFFCSFLGFIGFYDFTNEFPHKIIKNYDNINELKTIFLCIFILFDEKYFLKIETCQHHYLGFSIIIFSLIMSIVIKNPNLNIFVFSEFFLILIIFIESQFIEAILYTFEKKLTYEFFVNENYLCFFEGLIGIISTSIYFLWISQINLENLSINKLCIFLYILSSFLFNVYIYKIVNESRPSKIVIIQFFSSMIIKLYELVFEHRINYFYIDLILLLGGFIYCEIIVLNFCGFGKNTKKITMKRAMNETFSSTSEYKSEMPNIDNIIIN